MIPPKSTNGFRATDFRRSPLLVFYEMTQACGLVCQHCRASAKTDPDPCELTTADSLRLIDQLASFPDPPMLVLTGDALRRADIYPLIEYAVQAGLETSITPSATPLVTRGAIERLHSAGIHRMAISIDGADAATHDGVRGVEGSFARCLEILRDAQEVGLPTQVNTTLTPHNFHQIDAIAEMVAPFDIVLWSVFFLVPVGARNSPPGSHPSNANRLSDSSGSNPGGGPSASRPPRPRTIGGSPCSRNDSRKPRAKSPRRFGPPASTMARGFFSSATPARSTPVVSCLFPAGGSPSRTSWTCTRIPRCCGGFAIPIASKANADSANSARSAAVAEPAPMPSRGIRLPRNPTAPTSPWPCNARRRNSERGSVTRWRQASAECGASPGPSRPVCSPRVVASTGQTR